MITIEHYVGLETLVVERCWCGILHAIPKSLAENQSGQLNDGRPQTGIYCPLGHTWIRKGESEASKLEKKLQQERAAHDQTSAAKRAAEALAAKLEASQKRLRKRIFHGVCPCCHRTVKQLAAHMTAKHPEYK